MPNYNDIEDQRRAYDAMHAKASKLERENGVLKLRIRGLEAESSSNPKLDALGQMIEGLYASGLAREAGRTKVFAVLDERNLRKIDSIWLWEHRAVERMKRLTSRYAQLDMNAVCIEVAPMYFDEQQMWMYRAAHKAGVVDGLGPDDKARELENLNTQEAPTMKFLLDTESAIDPVVLDGDTARLLASKRTVGYSAEGWTIVQNSKLQRTNTIEQPFLLVIRPDAEEQRYGAIYTKALADDAHSWEGLETVTFDAVVEEAE